MFLSKNRGMDVMAAAKAYNQKAKRESWHYFCDPTLSFTSPIYDRLLEAWRARAGDRLMPARSEMGPRDIKDVLRNIVLVERDVANPKRFSWRLAGQGVTEILGSHTGKTFDQCVPAHLLPRWIESMNIILDGAQPMRFIGRVHISGREYLDAEHLYVPLSNSNGEPAYVMGLCRYTPRHSEKEEVWESQIASIPGALL
jgi:hypothetical protein